MLALPPRMRAVVVLRYFDDLSEADTAAALGMSVGSVKSQASRGLERLRSVLQPTVATPRPDDWQHEQPERHRREEPGMSIETQLREALVRPRRRGRRARAPATPTSGSAAPSPSSRRRRRTAALAGVAAVAAIAVADPDAVGGLGRDTTTPAKKTTVVVPGPSDPRWASMSTWPIRGSLATDTAFLDPVPRGVRRRRRHLRG